MSKNASKSDEPEGMSDESVGYLTDAKRGKARKFVLITKGMNVVSLIVYKKGSLEGYKKQAKEAGRGTLVYGVVTGQGENIRFQLAQSDGFEREPIKAMALKSFLQESADFNCKPSFEIVAAHGAVLDPDDPLAARYLALRPAALFRIG